MPISGGELLGSLNASQHQNMLLGMVGANSNGAVSEALAGRAMSRGLAVGAPLGMLGLGLMGLDPMSMGLRAGMGAWGRGAGLMGSAGMGIAAMAPAALGLAGAGYATNQMATGANQQLNLNGALRQFNFQNNQGGMGFTSGQGFQIGNQLRTMTHEFGPQGEVQTFGELSRLASNMGRMGLAQNVRSVQEFKEKFKEMVSTLKTVAHDMGSSLEEAQKFIVSMKSSGIFNKSDQLRASAATRSGALAGGLAQSEITGMGNIGSQISRSVGGLGRAGTFAGMAAMTNLGIAQRVGAVSEEDIYNATGLTGAEGRQAFAASQLQGSANFLRSGRGRKFLASITAGTGNGELDENALSEWMAGGMTTRRTMDLAHKNLKGTGRADFLRNEGRLRGAALQRLSELGVDPQTLAYQQWLSSKGYTPDNMDDKAMLAFQRFSGKGRDEADAAIKQIQALPAIMSEARNSNALMKYNDDLTKKLNTTGLVGLERKIDQVKEGINNTFQKAGSSILQAGQESIESWFNKVMGIYEEQATDAASKADAAIRHGDKAAFQHTFGMASLLGKGSGSLLQRAGMGSLTAAEGRSKIAMSDRDKIMKLTGAANMGRAPQALLDYAANHADEIRIASMSGSGYAGSFSGMEKLLKGAGNDFYTNDLEGNASTNGQTLARMFGNGSVSEKSSMMQAMQRAAGMEDKSAYSLLTRLGADKRGQGFLGKGGSYTVADREKLFGGYLSGNEEFNATYKRGQRVSFFGGGGTGEAESDEERGMARFAFGKDAAGMELLTSAYIGEGDEGKRARTKLIDIVQAKLNGGSFKDMSASDRGAVRMATGMYLATSPENKAAMETLRNGGTLSDAEYARLAKQYSSISQKDTTSKEGMKRFRAEIAAIAKDGATAVAMQSYEELQRAVGISNARSSYENNRRANQDVSVGLMNPDGGLVLDASKLDAVAGKSKDAVEAAKLALHAATMTVTDGSTYEQQMDEMGRAREAFSKLDLKTQRSLARTGGTIGEQAGEQAMLHERWRSMGKRFGDSGALAGSLGLSLGNKDMKALKGMSKQEMVHSLLGKAGLGDDTGKTENALMEALSAGTSGEKAFKVSQTLGSQEIRDKLEANKVRQAEANDPTFKLLNQHVPEQTKYLKLLVQSNDKAAAALQKLDNPESQSSGGAPNMSGG